MAPFFVAMKLVADLHREDEGVGHIFPVGAREDESLAVLPHVLEHLVPVAADLLRRPPVTVPLDVLDPADVGAVVKPQPPLEDASDDAADAVPHVRLRADLDAVVAVDERDVLDRVVEPLEVECPGIGWTSLGFWSG